MSQTINAAIAVIGTDILPAEARHCVRKGQRFLRAEAAHPGHVIRCSVALHGAGDLGPEAGDWRRLDERIEGLLGEIEAIARCWVRRSSNAVVILASPNTAGYPYS